MCCRQITIRLDLSKEREREVWDYLHRRGAGSCKREIVALVMQRMDSEAVCDVIRRTIEECLRGIPSAEAANGETSSSDEDLMGFLESF